MPDHSQQESVDTTALVLASGASAVLKQHLDECRDRYIQTQKSIESLSSLMWKGLGSLVILLLTIIGFLVTKSVSFGMHP